MTVEGAHPTETRNWTLGAPKFAAALTLLALAGVGLTLSVAQDYSRSSAPREIVNLAAGVDLNTATAAELEALPAIGPRRAEAIVADRLRNGPFGSIEALDRVPGIGMGTIERIRAYVIVTTPAPAADR